MTARAPRLVGSSLHMMRGRSSLANLSLAIRALLLQMLKKFSISEKAYCTTQCDQEVDLYT